MTNVGIEQAYGKPLLSKALRADLTRVDVPDGIKLGPYDSTYVTLNKFDVKCLMLQLAYVESLYDFTIISGLRYGRYLTSLNILQRYGFVDSNGIWLGKKGISESAEFLLNYSVQDFVIEEFLVDTYDALARNNGILPSDSASVVAGMLAVSYQFQNFTNNVAKAVEWRKTGAVNDDQGRPGYVYFNLGKYAVQSLAADISE